MKDEQDMGDPSGPGSCPSGQAADGVLPHSAAIPIARWREIALFLFNLLDDIDTASDWAKGDNEAYRKVVESLHRARFKVATTDGYSVTFSAQAIEAGGSRPGTGLDAKHESAVAESHAPKEQPMTLDDFLADLERKAGESAHVALYTNMCRQVASVSPEIIAAMARVVRAAKAALSPLGPPVSLMGGEIGLLDTGKIAKARNALRSLESVVKEQSE